MPTEPKYLLLGQVLRPHGVRGEVRVKILTDYPERMAQLEQVFLGSGADDAKAKVYTVDSARRNGEYMLLKIRDISDRDQADRLRQLFVMVALADAVPLDAGEFYLYQVIGLTVKLEDETVLGTITEVIETRANDVYVIASPQYGEVLIPVTEEIILKTDIAAREMIIRPTAGLLPES